METLPKTSFLVRLSPSTAKSLSNFQKYPEIGLFVKSKHNCRLSEKNLHLFFKKSINFWSNYYISKILSNNRSFFQDLVNEGHLIVQRRIKEIEVEEVFDNEQKIKNKTAKSWIENNINLWIRSYLKNYADKLKNNSDIDINSLDKIENKDICIQSKKDRKDYIDKCEEYNSSPEVSREENQKNCLSSKFLKGAIKKLNKTEISIINYLYYNTSDEKFSEKIKNLTHKLNVSDKRIYFIHSLILKKIKKGLKKEKSLY